MDSKSIAMAILLLCALEFHMVVSLSRKIPKGAIILGIDLGTTYSSMGVYRNGKVEIIPNDQGNLTTPSSVAFTNNELLIGEAAVNPAASNAERTIFNIIRFIGRKFDDETVQKDMEMLPYKVVNKSGRPYVEVNVKDGEVKAFSPEEICAMVLSNMKKTAESYLGKNVAFAIIAVPVYFNAAQKEAIKEAGSIAGLEVIRLLNKPMAAGVAYGFEYGKKHVLVYDLGGRTLDVNIIFINDGLIEISSSSRNTHLGGKDFDDRLMKHFIKIFKKKHGKDISKDSKALGKLNRECERAKRELSSQYQVSLEIESLFDGVDFSETLNRTTFEELNEDLFMETMEYVKKAMEIAKLKKTEIHEIILVGGSTMIPKIQDLLKEFFEGKEPVKGLGVNPDEVVAYGAAFLGRFYVEDEWGRDVQRCTDVSLLSLGVETVGGVMTTLVKRCCLPVKNSAIFTTYQDHQTSVEIKVFQGKRSLTKDCPELGRFTLSGIASALRGVPQIEVTFDVSYDNGLIVTAEEKGANNKQSITVLFDHLTMEEVKRIVAEARLFKEEDKKVMESMKPQNQLPIPSQARSNL